MMQRSWIPRYCIAFLTLTALCLFVPAQTIFADSDKDLPALLKVLEAKAAEVRTLTCNLKQERHLAIFSQPVVFRGRLALARPDKLRWEFSSPIHSVLIFNGTHGIRCRGESDPLRFDLNADPVMQMVSRQIWTWMDGAYSSLRKSYRIAALDPGPGLVIFPKDKKLAGVISRIEISFHPDFLQPTRVEIQEQGKDYTVITFSDHVLNRSIDESLFIQCSSQ